MCEHAEALSGTRALIPLILGSLNKDVFERRTSTGSETFSLFICLYTTKFVLLSFFSPIKTIYPRVSTKPQPNAAKSPLPVDVRRSKTLLLKLPYKSAGLLLHVRSLTTSPQNWPAKVAQTLRELHCSSDTPS